MHLPCLGNLAAVYLQPNHNPTQSHCKVVNFGNTYRKEEAGAYKPVRKTLTNRTEQPCAMMHGVEPSPCVETTP